jgi:hypothetical protein
MFIGYDSSKARLHDRRGEAVRTAFVAASILGLLLYGLVFASWAYEWQYSDALVFMIGFPTGKDFINLYAAGQIFDQSLDLDTLFFSDRYAAFLTDLFNTDVHQYHYVWSYPPTMLLPARLFAGLPYLPAFAVWSVVTMALYLGGLYLAGLRGWWLLAAVLAPAAAVNLFFGQYGFLLAGLLLGGLSQRDARPLLGLATIKPQMGLLLPILLLAERQWRVMAAAAATALALIALSIALDGIAAWRQYFAVILPVQRMFLEEGVGFFMLLTVTPFMAGKIVGLGVPLLYMLQFAVTLVCAVGVYQMGSRGKPLPAMVFTLAAAFIATPYAMAYDLPILAGAGLLLLASRPDFLDGAGRAVAFAMLWMLPLVGLSGNLLLVALAPFVIALFAWQLWRHGQDQSR